MLGAFDCMIHPTAMLQINQILSCLILSYLQETSPSCQHLFKFEMLNVHESVIREYLGEDGDGHRKSTQRSRPGATADGHRESTQRSKPGTTADGHRESTQHNRPGASSDGHRESTQRSRPGTSYDLSTQRSRLGTSPERSHQMHDSDHDLDIPKPVVRRRDIPLPVRSDPSRPRIVTSDDFHLRWQTAAAKTLRRLPSLQTGRVTDSTGKQQPSGRYSMIAGHTVHGRPSEERSRQTDSPSRLSCQRQRSRTLSSGRDVRLEGSGHVGGKTGLRRHAQHGSVSSLDDKPQCRPRSDTSETRNEKVQARKNTIQALENVRLLHARTHARTHTRAHTHTHTHTHAHTQSHPYVGQYHEQEQ